MQAALDLVQVNQVTHRAVRNGRWDDPNTWEGGNIPDQNSKVHIPENLTVTYGTQNDVRHDTVRVDGTLEFATNQSSTLLLDTIVVTETGELQIGTEANPVQANQSVDIVFSSNTNIAQAGDPAKLRRGLINLGKATIVGSDKLDHVKLAQEALAGDNELVLDLPDGMTEPEGWQVGDRIVLGGTDTTYNGSDADNSRLQDEVLEIREINGNRISFRNTDIQDGPQDVLRFDHTLPDVAESDQLNLYVANTTRNVTFSSEGGKDTPINRRGHTFFAQNPNVEIRNAGFVGLGRSDKSQLVDDPGQNVDGSPGNGTNPRGRYSVHLHRLPNNTLAGDPVTVSGNAIVGSPGWGLVNHDSKADFVDNVVFDTLGSGIVAEGGIERGRWQNNIVIKTTGIDFREASRTREDRDRLFDLGFRGDGYWIQGAGQVEFEDNIAISSNQTGLTIFGDSLDPDDDFRDVTTVAVADLPADIRAQVAKPGQTEVDVTDIPLRGVNGFESYNANIGFLLWAHQTNFDGEGEFSSPDPKTAHELRSEISDLKVWGNRYRGLQVQYSTQVDFNNGLVIGDPDDPRQVGVDNNHAAFNNQFNNFNVQGFKEGFRVPLNGSENRERDYLRSTLSNSTFRDNTNHLSPVRRGSGSDLGSDFPSDVRLQNNQFSEQSGNQTPTASFSSQAVGGLSVRLDGSQSRDPDPTSLNSEDSRPTSSSGIVSYEWDFDNDGRTDATGRDTLYRFSSPGSKTVSLTVRDTQGATATTQRTIEVNPSAYRNPFVDSDFAQSEGTLENWQSNNGWAGEGWFTTFGVRRDAGHAVLSNPQYWGAGIGQVVANNQVNQGEQTLQFDLKNIEGAPSREFWRNNAIDINLWGINGQFDNNVWRTDAPEQVGTLPFQAQNLFSTTIGGRESVDERETFDWRTFRETVDLGQGYQFLLFQVNSTGARDNGDEVALDNVSLTGSANQVPIETPDPIEIPDPDPIETPEPIEPPAPGDRTLTGTDGADRLVGTDEDDDISGGAGNDALHGRAGSDRLAGDAGNDRIRGSMYRAGENDIDTLEGGAGRDRFIVGSNRHQFYLNQRRSGNASYARIVDFDLSQDKLVLTGEASDYRLGTITRDGERGAGVFFKENGPDDLVAFLEGVTDLNALRNSL